MRFTTYEIAGPTKEQLRLAAVVKSDANEMSLERLLQRFAESDADTRHAAIIQLLRSFVDIGAGERSDGLLQELISLERTVALRRQLAQRIDVDRVETVANKALEEAQLLRQEVGQIVYFISAANGGPFPVKIGIAYDPNKRLTELQVGCPEPLAICAQIPGGPELEALLHDHLSDYSTCGEWFQHVPEILAIIDRARQVPSECAYLSAKELFLCLIGHE